LAYGRKIKIMDELLSFNCIMVLSHFVIANMAPLNPKRRKLDHQSSSPVSEDQDLDTNINEESQADTSQKTITKSTRPKRSHDEDGAAIYAGGSYKSSMFKLQVDELLSEVQPNYEKRLEGVDVALRKLKDLIESIEGRDALSVR
jgi:U3 small nucleolar RNA-associated protein 22